MANLSKKDLFTIIERSIRDAGWNYIRLSKKGGHPFVLSLFKENEARLFRIYIWNLTHGGGASRPKNEFRIQITGISQFQQYAGEKTIILGWWASGQVFAGFDYNKHSAPLGSSPSIQIREATLDNAATNGIAAGNKGNGELAISFKPEMFIPYILNIDTLHSSGETQSAYEILQKTIQDEFDEASLYAGLSESRRYGLVNTKRAIRDVRFRDRVLTAYKQRCSVCGLQLNLIDAAHVLPVAHPKSTDETCSGIALCALHHKAYDAALLTFDVNYKVVINQNRLNDLKKVGLDGGLGLFREITRPVLALPPDVRDRPAPAFIKLANQLRGW
jgi:putative restriction endonuclease